MEKGKRPQRKQVAFAFLSCLLFLSCSKKEVPQTETKVWSSGSHKISIPAGWDYEDQSGRETSGFVLIKGVPSQDELSQHWAEPATLIRLSFYKSGGGYFESPEAMMKQAAKGAVIKNQPVGKIKAEAANFSYQESFPPHSMEAKKYDSRDTYVFFRQKEGFWVFQYTAIGTRYPQHFGDFASLIEQF